MDDATVESILLQFEYANEIACFYSNINWYFLLITMVIMVLTIPLITTINT